MSLPVRRSGQKSGGGYLNGVSGVIESITFKAGKSGEGKKGKWAKYSGVVNVRADGADKTVPQFLDAGFLPAGCSVSEDGTTIEGKGKYLFDGNTNFGKFILSLVEGPEGDTSNRLDEERLGDCRNFASIAGIRVTFRREYDVQGTIEAGLRKLKIKDVTDANREKVIDAGKREMKKDGKVVKGEDGKVIKLMLDQLLVAEVLSVPEEGKSGKSSAAGAGKVTKVVQKVAEPSDEFDIDEVDELVKSALDGTEGATRNALGSAFVKASLRVPALKTDSKRREAVRKFVISDEYLIGAVDRGLLVIDGDGKDQSITLVG